MNSPATTRVPKDRRVEMRLTAEQDDLITSAAEMANLTKTAFIVNAAAQHAQQVLQRAHAFPISGPAFDDLLEELNHPAEAIPSLVELFKRVV